MKRKTIEFEFLSRTNLRFCHPDWILYITFYPHWQRKYHRGTETGVYEIRLLMPECFFLIYPCFSLKKIPFLLMAMIVFWKNKWKYFKFIFQNWEFSSCKVPTKQVFYLKFFLLFYMVKTYYWLIFQAKINSGSETSLY